MSKRPSFKYLKWKLPSQMDSGAFVKIKTRKNLLQKKSRCYVTRNF